MNAYILGYAILQLPQVLLMAYKNVKKKILDIILQHQREPPNQEQVVGQLIPAQIVASGNGQENSNDLVAESAANVEQLVSVTSEKRPGFQQE